jgi:hypothetical protein
MLAVACQHQGDCHAEVTLPRQRRSSSRASLSFPLYHQARMVCSGVNVPTPEVKEKEGRHGTAGRVSGQLFSWEGRIVLVHSPEASSFPPSLPHVKSSAMIQLSSTRRRRLNYSSKALSTECIKIQTFQQNCERSNDKQCYWQQKLQACFLH